MERSLMVLVTKDCSGSSNQYTGRQTLKLQLMEKGRQKNYL
jgi:hypothetical protein